MSLFDLYSCECCNFKNDNKTKYKNHLITTKHQKKTNNYNKTLMCVCGKLYKYKQNLVRHKSHCKKICNGNTELLTLIVKQNQETLTQNARLLELASEPKVINKVTNNFNLNVFLNDTCKGAYSITEYVDKIELMESDLERVVEVGYKRCIEDILIRNVKMSAVTERPFHCTDVKRESNHVKKESGWIMNSDSTHEEIRFTLKYSMQTLALRLFKMSLDYEKNVDKNNDADTIKYSKMMVEIMSALNVEYNDASFSKIITNLSKYIAIKR